MQEQRTAGGGATPRAGYHHRDLRAALLLHGIELAQAGGPDAVSIRDVQRRAGVSNSAAYRHFVDRTALLEAISEHALETMAQRMATLLARIRPRATAADTARARFRAVGEAYLECALAEPGLYRVAFATTRTFDPARAKADDTGPLPLVTQCLDDLVETGVLDPRHRPLSEVALWASLHGLALLLLDGPLRQLTPPQRRAAIRRLLDVVGAGMV